MKGRGIVRPAWNGPATLGAVRSRGVGCVEAGLVGLGSSGRVEAASRFGWQGTDRQGVTRRRESVAGVVRQLPARWIRVA